MTKHDTPDCPPQISAIDAGEGARRYGSTGQLWEARLGVWHRIPAADGKAHVVEKDPRQPGGHC